MAAGGAIPRGGELGVSVRSDPKSFNRHLSRGSTTQLVSNLVQGRLVQINQATRALEASLAEGWTVSPDGLRYTLTLRQGVVFSDGQPFTADDVLFSLQAAYDEKTDSSVADLMEPGGKKLQIAAPDPHTVVITFATPYAPGIRILDDLPMLPRHLLEPALKAGTFNKAWGLDTPPAQIAGLGPFVLSQYVPGQRLVFARNPHYFLKAADGASLPYLDRLVIEIIPDQNASILRLEAGQLDMMTTEISPDSYAPLKRAADEGHVKLLDLGVSRNADGMWFNLKSGALGQDARAAWLQRDELRRAISAAVDRKLFADTCSAPACRSTGPRRRPTSSVLAGAAADAARSGGGEAPARGHRPRDRNGDGMLEDARNQPARFTLLTQKGRTNLERSAAVIRDELKKIGLVVDVAALDGAAAIDRFLNAKYDAVYFSADRTDLDPGTNPDFWFSSGSAHLLNLEEKTPATDWERRIDELMTRQIASPDPSERKRLYDEVQKIFAEHLPVVYFVAPRIYAASSVLA